MKALIPVAAGLLAAAAMPVVAHHSLDAEFDRTKPVTVTGVVTKVEWMNPHIWYYMDVKDADGKITKWQFEGGPPNALRRAGWNRNSLNVGDTVTVEGIMAKIPVQNGVYTGNTSTIRLADGRRVLGRDPNDDVKGKAK
jgi:hypothetical protein